LFSALAGLPLLYFRIEQKMAAHLLPAVLQLNGYSYGLQIRNKKKGNQGPLRKSKGSKNKKQGHTLNCLFKPGTLTHPQWQMF
jgi:hypothetical protein